MHICLFVLNLRQLESSKRNEKTKQKTKHKKTHTQNTQTKSECCGCTRIYMFKCQNNNTIQTKQCLLRIYLQTIWHTYTSNNTSDLCVCFACVCSSCALFAGFFSFFFLFFTKKRNEKREKDLFFGGGMEMEMNLGGGEMQSEKREEKIILFFFLFFPTTNRENKGLISVDRSNKATLLLTIPRSCI